MLLPVGQSIAFVSNLLENLCLESSSREKQNHKMLYTHLESCRQCINVLSTRNPEDDDDQADFSVLPALVRAQTSDTLDSLHVSLLRVQNESRDHERTAHFTLPPSVVSSFSSEDDLADYDDDDDTDEDSTFGPDVTHVLDADFGQPQRPGLWKEKMDDALDIVNVWNWPSRGECQKNVKVNCYGFLFIRRLIRRLITCSNR